MQRFDVVVAAQPDAPALVAGAADISFRELQATSVRIAREIRDRLGDGDRPVAVLCGQTPLAVAALLGIARTGRPFMNLDATLPDSRLAQMQELGRADACLVESATRERGAGLGFDGPCIDISAIDDAAPPGHPDATPTPPGQPACVLFTSGSTGEPKGIVWPEGVLMKDALAGLQVMEFTPDDRVGLVLPMTFAAGLSVVAWGLTSGASLHLFDPRRNAVAALTEWIAREQLTTLHCTPTLLRAILRAITPDQRFPALRLVTTCGEPVRAADVHAVREQLSAASAFVNWTGSSEVGVLALHRIAPGDAVEDGPIPAGRPVDGLSVEIHAIPDAPSVAADNARPQSAGPPGELIVESDHIALGYLGEPGELADRFSVLDDGRRRYRSGDLATLGPDGELRLWGRRDAAIKIRGYLVEPSEIEAALLETDEVVEAAVITEHRDTDPQLVAFVVSTPARVLSISRLRAHLRERLPIYMQPAAIVPLQELPRTERGKIDRDALAQLGSRPGSPYRAPQTDREVLIAQIWADVLGVDRVGVDDDFFALGGDSLAVEEVLSELHRYGTYLPTAAFIRAPTVAGLAAMAGERTASPLRGDMVEMRRASAGIGAGPTVFCFAGAGGVALSMEALVRHLDLDATVYGIQMHALEERGIPDFSVNQAAVRFLKEFAQLQPRGPYILAGYSYGGLVAFEAARRLRAHGHRVELLALLDSFPPNVAEASSNGDAPGRLEILAGRLAAARSAASVREASQFLRILTAGPIRYRGRTQYELFEGRGYHLQRLYRAKPYPGRTVLYIAERNTLAIDHTRWQHWLTGPFETALTPGDHFTMLREPWVEHLAGDLRGRIIGDRIPT